MRSVFNIYKFEQFFNALELLGVLLMLVLAFSFQVILKELPCPLCLLQRVGFFGVALGFLMNLRFGLRPSHYSLVILNALFSCFVALRQIALHVTPGSGSYGYPFLGLHLYTWSFIISMLVIIFTTIMLGMDRQYTNQIALTNRCYLGLIHVLFAMLLLLVGINVVAVFMECGVQACPDNPIHYLY